MTTPCAGAAIWEYDGPARPGIQHDYVYSGALCEEFTIESEETTQLVNYSDDILRGVLDVLRDRSTTGAPIADDDILVLLFDQDNNLVDWECTETIRSTDSRDGWVSFYWCRKATTP